MRAAFVRALVELAARDERILLLTGDLGFMALEPFAERFPSRFLNVGVAEQNLVGLATGLAGAGFVPFVYSIAPFMALRPYEVIRNGPLLHRLPVRLVGMGGGFDYGKQGLTHWALEDVGVFRIQPGMTVFVPVDRTQVPAAVAATSSCAGPVYLRLGRDSRPPLPGLEGRFRPEAVEISRPGRDGLLLAMGSIAAEAAAAAETLEREGIDLAVGVVVCVQPAPRAALVRALTPFPFVVTVEAHYAAGGLGSLVAETLAEEGIPCRLVRCAVHAAPDGLTGSSDYLHERYGLSREAIAEAARRARSARPGGGAP